MTANTGATNVVWHESKVSTESRCAHKSQKPCILRFTGFSGSGKSTIANAVEHRLAELKQHTYLLDGDNVRHDLNSDLGLSEESRTENIRWVGELTKLFVDAGLIVYAAFISPFKAQRQTVRNLVGDREFIETFMNTPLSASEERDPKGLYKKARAGEIKDFTGNDSCYEPQETSEITLDSSTMSVEECVEAVINYLRAKEML